MCHGGTDAVVCHLPKYQTEAKVIAHTLVGDRLATCANILGPMTSIYRWDGEVAEQEEVGMLLKTYREVTVHVAERVKSPHSMTCHISSVCPSRAVTWTLWPGCTAKSIDPDARQLRPFSKSN
jgi:uncharacterized protein involved in tolerance to divalent cations